MKELLFRKWHSNNNSNAHALTSEVKLHHNVQLAKASSNQVIICSLRNWPQLKKGPKYL